MAETGLRRWAADGARGVLMGAAACAPEATLTSCRQIWDLGREDDEVLDLRVVQPGAGVHVVGASR